MGLEYVAAYFSYLDYLAELSDAECGRLFKACLMYGKTGATPELRGNERYVWPGIKSQIDRDAEKYKRRCEKNSQNVKARWNANGYERIPANTKDTKEKAKEKEKAKDINNPPHKSPQGDDVALQAESLKVETAGGAGKPVDHSTTLVKQRFNEFWREYPKKTGKGAAEKAWNKIKPDRALFDSIMSALKAVKKSDQWRRENGQYIPNPSTWLNQRRWEDEIPKPTFSAGSSSLDDDEITRLFERGSIGI